MSHFQDTFERGGYIRRHLTATIESNAQTWSRDTVVACLGKKKQKVSRALRTCFLVQCRPPDTVYCFICYFFFKKRWLLLLQCFQQKKTRTVWTTKCASRKDWHVTERWIRWPLSRLFLDPIADRLNHVCWRMVRSPERDMEGKYGDRWGGSSRGAHLHDLR